MFTYKNAEGYPDPTMFTAIIMADSSRSRHNSTRTLTWRPLHRGDIYLARRGRYSDGPGCPVVVVSGDMINKSRGQIQIVYLTMSPKNNLPTNVEINGTGKQSFAKCGEVSCIPASSLYDFVGRVTDDEMKKIDAGIRLSLGIEAEKSTKQLYKETIEHKIQLLQRELELIASMSNSEINLRMENCSI